MKNTLYILSIVVLFSCGSEQPKTGSNDSTYSITLNRITDRLETGWYYLTVKGKGIERQLNGTEEIYYIDPNPIATVDNFKELEIYQSSDGDYGMTIKLDAQGTKKWGVATGKSIGNKLALVIKNELLFTPIVNSQIDIGISALNRGDLTEEQLIEIKKKVEKEKNI